MIGIYAPQFFDIMHVQVWQALFIFIASSPLETPAHFIGFRDALDVDLPDFFLEMDSKLCL